MKGEKILYDQTEFPTYRIEFDAKKHVVDFKVFEVNGAYGTEPPWVIADEEHALNASIKWDGCSNWEYVEIAHFCGVNGVMVFGDMQIKLYALAAELMGVLGTTYPADNPEEFFLEHNHEKAPS